MQKTIGVGIAIIIEKSGEVLFVLRNGTHAGGTWGFPGGKMEYGEGFVPAILREVREELKIRITTPTFFYATNDYFSESGKHYITIFMKARYLSGTCISCEPEKHGNGVWFPKDALPSPLMLPIANLLRAVKSF